MVLLLHKLMLSGENGINVPLIQHSPNIVVGGDVASSSAEKNMVTMHGPAPALLLQFDYSYVCQWQFFSAGFTGTNGWLPKS